MGFFAGMMLCYSACLAVEGLMPRLTCLPLCLLAALLGRKAPSGLAPLFACAFLLRAAALGRVLTMDMGERGWVLFALCLVCVLGLCFVERARLCRAFLPCGLVLLPFLGFSLAGEWSVPNAVVACPPAEMLLALVCPLSAGFWGVRVQNRWWTVWGVVLGGVFGVLAVFANFPVWEGAAAVMGSVLPMSLELRMLRGKPAYTFGRRDAHETAKRNPAGNRARR